MHPTHIFFFEQQPYVLAELAEYIDTKPEDASSASLVLKYLKALNSLFENGFLSHEKIESSDSPLLQRMEAGYNVFVQWLDSALEKGMYFAVVFSTLLAIAEEVRANVGASLFLLP